MLWTQLVKSEVPVRDWECEGKWAGKMKGRGGCQEELSPNIHPGEKGRVLGGSSSTESTSQLLFLA